MRDGADLIEPQATQRASNKGPMNVPWSRWMQDPCAKHTTSGLCADGRARGAGACGSLLRLDGCAYEANPECSTRRLQAPCPPRTSVLAV